MAASGSCYSDTVNTSNRGAGDPVREVTFENLTSAGVSFDATKTVTREHGLQTHVTYRASDYTPLIKISTLYTTAEKTTARRVIKYDFIYRPDWAHGRILAPRRRGCIFYNSSGGVTRKRLYFYTNENNWSKPTHKETLIPDGLTLTGGSKVDLVRRCDYTVSPGPSIEVSTYSSSSTPRFSTTKVSSVAYDVEAEGGTKFSSANVGSIPRDVVKRQILTRKGFVDAAGTNSTLKTTFLEQTTDGLVLSKRCVAGAELSAFRTEQRDALNRSNLLNKRSVHFGVEMPLAISVSYSCSSNGLLQKKTVFDESGETPAVLSTREYTYAGRKLVKIVTTLASADSSGATGYVFNYTDGERPAGGGLVNDSLFFPGSLVSSAASDVFAFILSELDTLCSSKARSFDSMALLNIRRCVALISSLQSSITKARVSSIVGNAKSLLRLLAGRSTGDQSATLRFFLDSILAHFGVLTSAESQCEYLTSCVDVVCSRPGLRIRLAEFCDISVWGIEGIGLPTSCATGYTFDPDFVSSACSVCSQTFSALKTGSDDLIDTRDLLTACILRAAPSAIPSSNVLALQVINVALARCGVSKQVASLDEGSTEAKCALVLLDQCRRNFLLAQHWSFAVADLQVSSKTNILTNPERWPCSARLPADCLTVEGIWTGQRFPPTQMLVPFEVLGGRLFSEVQDPWIRYVRNCDLSYWNNPALDALAWMLAFELTMPLTVKPDLAQALFRMSELATQRAAAHDKNNRQLDAAPDGKFITGRR